MERWLWQLHHHHFAYHLEGTPLPGLTITKRAFIVKSSGDTFHSGAHYDITIPDMPDEFACSGSSSKSDLTTYVTPGRRG